MLGDETKILKFLLIKYHFESADIYTCKISAHLPRKHRAVLKGEVLFELET